LTNRLEYLKATSITDVTDGQTDRRAQTRHATFSIAA